MTSESKSAKNPTYGPFAETTPSGQTGWIDERRRPIKEHVHLMLQKLDSNGKYTYSIWRGTDPESIVVTSQDPGETFIQAAGSADQMTVEMRLVDEEGEGHLYTVGKNQPVDDSPIVIPIGVKNTVLVFKNEVFDAEEATRLFVEFYEKESLDTSYVLREREIG